MKIGSGRDGSEGPPVGEPAGRHFLLLQGPCGGFFRALQRTLERRGHKCTRVILNGGDLVSAGLGRKILYFRSFADWPHWLSSLQRSEGITDMICYGDCRPYHRAAMAALKPRGVRVHVLEEGYLRPHWITCERDGVNGFSKFASLDLSRLVHPKLLAMAPAGDPGFPGTQAQYMWAGFVYYLITMLLTPLFPRYQSHRDLAVAGEGALWLRRFSSWPFRRSRTERLLRTIARRGKPIHLVLLQLNGDSQIKQHSRFSSLRDFVEFCIAEYAASGVSDALLVFKNHPLDNGVISLASLIRQTAIAHGVSERVFFVETGKLVPLLENALSVTAINSTACHQSLRRGIPTLVLGNAVFNHPEIVPRMRLADFFRLRPVTNLQAYNDFVILLRLSCQIYGGFYGRTAQQLVLKPLADMLIDGSPDIGSLLKPERRQSGVRQAS